MGLGTERTIGDPLQILEESTRQAQIKYLELTKRNFRAS
jgi:hypothetical protein